MTTSLSAASLRPILAALDRANARFIRAYPGDPLARQPVQTVYGGAHLFKADAARKLGDLALASLNEYGPDYATFARAIGLRGAAALPESETELNALTAALAADPARVKDTNPAAWLAHAVYTRVVEKLKREPVEDFRIDFEDGYGYRTDAEEDATAAQAAAELASGMERATLPPFIGIRIKTFSRELHARGVRTLDIFLTTLSKRTRGHLPDNFVVTLPKVTSPEQVEALISVFEAIERATAIAKGSLRMELMIETTQSIFDPEGNVVLPLLVRAARGRCIAAHFGVYDYTASVNLTSEQQSPVHRACEFARDVMQVSLSGTGVMMSDGATNILPVGPHRAPPGQHLSAQHAAENRAAVHRAWRLHYEHVRHSLGRGYYQGWDLHPGQFPTRYAAMFAFYLEPLQPATHRMRNFVDKAARATLAGDIFDDAATAQGLLTFFLRGLKCGAISREEVLATGLTVEEMQSRSFTRIMTDRANAAATPAPASPRSRRKARRSA
jgi:citrate lyase beta subunit